MRKRALPLVRAGTIDGALDAAVLAQLSSADLEQFLRERRWFGAKGRRATSVAVADVVPVEHEGHRAAVARVEVGFGDETQVYQLPLATCGAEDGERSPNAILARVATPRGAGLLYDAAEDEHFRAAIAAGFARGRTFQGETARWIVEPIAGGQSAGIDVDTPSRISAGEQSNTSIVYGDGAILKLFRRLEEGENPDVEIGRFLTTRTRFRNIPALLGTIAFEDRGGRRMVAGMLQRYVAGSTDAWRDTLTRARGWFESAHEGENAYARDAESLGDATRRMHDALASDPDEPDFAPRPATGEDVTRWAAATRRSIENAIALLADRLTALPEEVAADAGAIVERRSSFTDTVAEQAAALAHDAGEKIRHHGDYHLGQVLRAPDGAFMIIDFEGEPARPLAERRERASALRDVAGMLRSFAYAAATLATEQRSRGSDATDLDARAARWEQEVRAAFLRGYMREPLPGYLPAAREHVDALLSLFETEKVFYELAYELNNRPDWAWIPIQGIGRLLSAHATHSGARR